MRYLDKAVVLHTRPYRETSALVKLFSLDHGMLSCVIKGMHGANKTGVSLRSALQTGNLIEFECRSGQSLNSVYHADLLQKSELQTARQFMCLSYINELLMFFFREDQGSTDFFEFYLATINSLSGDENIEPVLRNFEFELLAEMGYAIDFAWDVLLDEEIKHNESYTVEPSIGVRVIGVQDDSTSNQSVENDSQQRVYPGSILLAIAQRQLESREVLQAAKQINRGLLDFYMDGCLMKSRKLYQELFTDSQPVA